MCQILLYTLNLIKLIWPCISGLRLCSWNWEKLKFTRSFNSTLKSRFLQHQYQEQVKMFAFISWLVSHEACIHIQYFYCVARTLNTKYLELIKRRSKVQGKNMSCERALNFDQWRTFPKTISQWESDYGLFTNLPRIIKFTDFSPSSFKLKRGILPLLTKYVS